MNFETKCYEAYKLDWMIGHGYTLKDLYDILLGIAVEEIEEEPMSVQTDEASAEAFAACITDRFWTDSGFNGSMYACKDEFLENEFRDEEYMEHLFSMMPGREENMALWKQAVGKETAVTKETATIIVSENEAAFIEKIINEEPADESECFKEDETRSFKAQFSDGHFADVKVCGVQYREGESNMAWTEAVLFDKNGSQVSCSEPSDTFFGEWELYDGDRVYIVEVKKAPVDPTESLKVHTTAGTLVACRSIDPGLPGICIMLQPKGRRGQISVAWVYVLQGPESDYYPIDGEGERLKDINIRVYEDPSTEDHTRTLVIHGDEITEAIKYYE